MGILIQLAGEHIGPFSAHQVRQYLDEGLIASGDLARHEESAHWQTVDAMLAGVPRPAAAPETNSVAEPIDAPEPVAIENLELELDFSMSLPAPESSEATLASPVAEPNARATQKVKRKPGKIVVQPILPLEATASSPKKSRTKKTAVTIQTPLPTTSLPAITAPRPREKKSPTKTLLRPSQMLPTYIPEKRETSESLLTEAVPASLIVTPAAPAPVPEAAPRNAPPPPEKSTTTALPDWVNLLPREAIYACAVLALILLYSAYSFFFPSPAPQGAPAPSDQAAPERTPPPAPQAEVTPSAHAPPKTADDYNKRGFSEQSHGNLDGAISAYTQALVLDPKNVQACFQRGLIRQIENDLDGALTDFTQVLSLDPRNADAFKNRGFVKQAKGDLDGAIADYNQALLINPANPVVYYNQGLIAEKKGDPTSALAAYNHALDLDPKMDIAYYNRGNIKDAEGNLDGAIADFTQALVLNPKNARAYCNRGFARQSKGDADGALTDYAQALALNPKMADAYYNQGLIKEQKGDLDGAIADSTQALNLDPKKAQAYCNRGLARLGKNDLDGALTDLRKFCELASGDSHADYVRLYIWLISTEENPKGKANDELAAALQNDWNSTPGDLASQIAAFLLDHMTEADLLANLNSTDPGQDAGKSCKTWYFAGMKRLLAGDMATAIDYFHKCLATGQKDFCEYVFAQSELQALGQGPSAPAKPDPGH